MTSTAPETARSEGERPSTIGGIAGAPSAARAAELAARAVGGADSAPVTMTAPFTGQPIATLPQATEADVRTIFANARAAQRDWAATPAKARQDVLTRLHKLVLKRQQEGLDVIQVETGKSRVDAFDEIMETALAAGYYGKHSAKLLKPKRRAGAIPAATYTEELRHPKGTVAIITPWNYPLTLTALDVLPALAAGNAVVHKPDNQTALSALWLHELAEEAGLPAGVWQMVFGRGSVIGDALVEEGDYLAFTGSTPVGKQLAAKSGARLTGHSFELGGKNPMIVLPDAKIGAVASTAMTACFSSAGQLCVSAERIFVHESMKQEFSEAFATQAKGIKLGTGLDFKADVGSLTSAEQLETITAAVEDAKAKGATVLAGGRARPDIGPLFYEPTVLTDVTPDMKVFADETFGPVVSIYGYTEVDDAIERANDTPYGLNASVWTRNQQVGREVAARIRAGTVNINEGFAASFGSVDAPMGGFGDSGVGRRNGAEGLLRFTEVQTVAAQRVIKLRPFLGVPTRVWAGAMTVGVRVLRMLPWR